MSNHTELLSELGLDIDLHEKLLASTSRRYRETIIDQSNRPEGMAYFDRAVHESHGGRIKEIVDARKNGSKMIGTFCIFVPDELILAASAIPVAICGGTAFSIPYAEKKLPHDICPLIKSTFGMAFSKTCPYGPIMDMAVGETTCDAKKKTWDLLSGFHVMEIPQKKSEQGRSLWLHEVRALRDRIGELTGREIVYKTLRDKIRLMNRKRTLLRELNDLRKEPFPPISGKDALVVVQVGLIDDIERFCHNLEALVAELRQRTAESTSPFPQGTVRILVAGCPSVMGNWKIHHIIETSGSAVVCDESCTGTRYYEHLVDDSGQTVDELIEAIADRYLLIDCSCFTPNNERVEHVVELAREYNVDAVVQYVLRTRVEALMESIGS